MKWTSKLVIFSLLVLVFAFSAAAYDVVVFENYETSYFLKDGKLSVEKRVLLRNVGNNPIIPGELHFRVYEQRGDKQIPVEIKNLVASNPSSQLTTRVTLYDDYSDVVVHVWNPVLPDFDLPLTISYDLDFKLKGVLFHEVQFPIEETTIPIRDSKVDFMLPNQFSVTFTTGDVIAEDNMNKVVQWVNEDDLSLEYSRLPLPNTPFRMVGIFWMTILVALGAIFIFLNAKRQKQ